MQTFDPAIFYRGYIDVLNARRFPDMQDFVHDVVTRNGSQSTLASLVADLTDHAEAVPDFHLRIADLIVQDDSIAVRLIYTGTPVRTWFGFEPAGVSVECIEIAIYRLRDGRSEQMSHVMDAADIQRQLCRRA